jgi:hypothetical protein
VIAEHELEGVEAPDFVEAFEAWRVWRVLVDATGFWLRSVVQPTVWPAGEALEAECLHAGRVARWFRQRRRKPHAVPEVHCECGIYGANLREIGQYLIDWPVDSRVQRVLGRVSLWGTVVECERGFRASRAYPLRLYVPARSALTARLRPAEVAAGLEAYGVPIEILPTSGAEAIRFLEQEEFAATRGADA